MSKVNRVFLDETFKKATVVGGDYLTLNDSEDNFEEKKFLASALMYPTAETAVTTGSAGALVATFASKAPHVILSIDGTGGKEYDTITGPGITGQLITVIAAGGTVTLDGGADNINTVGTTLAVATTMTVTLGYAIKEAAKWDVISSSDNDNT